jgi:signal transduction histidine kinase
MLYRYLEKLHKKQKDIVQQISYEHTLRILGNAISVNCGVPVRKSGGTIIEVGVFIYNNNLKMRISDDGVGFDVNSVKKGIGLANIKRRAELFSGKLQINSAPGNGCELLITIPMNEIN